MNWQKYQFVIQLAWSILYTCINVFGKKGHSLQTDILYVQLHLQTAYKKFFRDKKIGFPKLKSAKHSRKTYTTNNQNGTIAIVENRIKLPKIGIVKAKIHRQPDADWKIKSATISQDNDDKFYVSVLYEFDKTLDNGYGLFLTMLEYKLADRGKYFVKVDKWFPSSQLCYSCGKQHKEMKNLLTRQIVCDCGYTNDRDTNASLNIKKEGLRLLAM